MSMQEPLSPVKQALLKLHEMKTKLDAVEQARKEPIAIVGTACRFPGNVNTPEAFWDLLQNEGDAITEVPPTRWSAAATYDPAVATPGKMNTRWGGFLTQVEQFDAAFFGIAAREAQRMDPQQRLLLQVAWEALENAGQNMAHLAGSSTGVFVGASTHDYAWFHVTDPDAYTGTGTAHSVIANRLSYLMDFHGPSVAVDTACSSALVAVHLACQSLRYGECQLALAGGVNLILLPLATIAFSQARMMAANGRCKTFDAAADGFVRSEGCGVVVLKRLSDALADGDQILAVIRGSAVNQDGHTAGLTAPNSLSQQAVIRQALSNASVQAEEVTYIETHGTGTALGDPIEMEALQAVFGQNRLSCVLGAVKTNLGHLEAAAGIAGLVKVVLALQHQQIPANLHFHTLNPHISLDAHTPFVFPVRLMPWHVPDGQPYIAGVSSFGFGGTNAHLIIAEAPPVESISVIDDVKRPFLLPLSARSPQALTAVAHTTYQFLQQQSAPLTDICHAATVRHTHHEHRLALVADDHQSLIETLADYLQTGQTPRSACINPHPQVKNLAFVFSGQGSVWSGMGQQLWQQEPVFRDTIAACDTLFQQVAGWSLVEALNDANAIPDQSVRTDRAQPLLFAIQVGLAALWRSWGVQPQAVIGHSVGEIAAAHIAGILSLTDAIHIVYQRSRLMHQAVGQGQMCLIGLPLANVEALIMSNNLPVSIAAINGPRAIVVAGKPEAIQRLLACVSPQTFTRLLPMPYAFHSDQMTPAAQILPSLLSHIQPQAGYLPMISTVTGEFLPGTAFDAAYWSHNVSQTVQFAPAVTELLRQGFRSFVEIGPQPALTRSIQHCLEEKGETGVVVASWGNEYDEQTEMLLNLGRLYTAGYDLDWQELYPQRQQPVRLPNYPWQQERYWLEPGNGNTLPWLAQPQTHISSWLYQLTWEPYTLAPAQSRPGHWLIFADTEGLGDALAQYLAQNGATSTHIYLGTDFQIVHANTYQVNPAEEASWQQLWAALRYHNQEPDTGIIYLWGIDTPSMTTMTQTDLAAMSMSNSAAIVRLVQMVNEMQEKTRPRLWLVTKHVHAFTTQSPDQTQLAQAPLWGLGQTIALEHPDLWGGLIDIDDTVPETADFVYRALHQPTASLRLAHRTNTVYTAHLVPTPSPPLRENPVSWSAEGAYLITGGLGGLGLQVAQWMAQQGARHLILLGRTALPPRSEWDQQEQGTKTAERIAAVQALETAGVQVELVTADVADANRLSSLFAQWDAHGLRLRGIVHAAGISPQQTVANLTPNDLYQTLQPKMMGAWILHQLSQRWSLDFFICFSSIASVWGSKYLGAYAAANYFLDVLAQYRQAQGLPALSINWGPWGEVGLATAVDRELLTQMGIHTITPEQGVQALATVLSATAAQIVVAHVDWQQFKPIYNARQEHHLFTKISLDELPTLTASAAANTATIVSELEQLPEVDRLLSITTVVQQEVGHVLGLAETGNLDLHKGLFDMGLDSLMAVDLKNSLEKRFGVPLSVTLAFDYPSIHAIATYLQQTLFPPTNTNLSHAIGSGSQTASLPESAPIAVIGMDCRLPGGADSPEAYWQLLRHGVDAITEVPADRWDLEALFDPTPDTPGKMYTRWGGFLDHIDTFDARFFGIPPREAAGIDPQQRLLLETSWHALEYAHIPPSQLAGSRTGVFIGITASDYLHMQMKLTEAADIDRYATTGNALNVAAGRLAYFLGLQGPAIAVDTACSSSLVAVHLACQSLRSGECDLALAGGVNVLLTPEVNIALSHTRMMAADGRCKTFAANADGYVRGEGCGVVILKPLHRAVADGDAILAVIRGSAVNQDGASSGLTVPNGQAQQAVIRAALQQADISPEQISYVEAHGTGTSLGDPIEMQALASVLRAQDKEQRQTVGQSLISAENASLSQDIPSLPVGSVKTNIGHLESAAGIASLIKVILALHHREIPPHLHFHTPSPHIPWEQMNVYVPTALTSWQAQEGKCIAGISSFGFSGTNAHVIVEEAPVTTLSKIDKDLVNPPTHHLLTLSAQSQNALHALAQRYEEWLVSREDLPLADICYSANYGRSHLSHRLVITTSTPAQLQAQLAAFTHDSEAPETAYRHLLETQAPKVVFLYSGQGSQYIHMGRQLFQQEQVFRDALTTCADLLLPYLERPLLSILYPETTDAGAAAHLQQTAYTQPALFALQYALTRLWASWGITPDAVLGHSLGEYTAAVTAGVMTLADGLRLVAERGRLMQALPQTGAMAVIFADEETVASQIAPYRNAVAIAAINGPENTVISGERAAVTAVLARAAAAGSKTRPLSVSHAFHSPLVVPMCAPFRDIVASISLTQPQLKLVSNVTGDLATESITDPAYWEEHTRAPVRFAQGIATLYKAGYRHFVEIGPRTTLLGMARRCLPAAEDAVWLPSLRQNREDRRQILSSLGHLYLHGADVHWQSLAGQRHWVQVPGYPFQRKRYWFTDHVQPRIRHHDGREATIHPLIERQLDSPLAQMQYASYFHRQSPLLEHHRLHEMMVVPGSCYVSMALDTAVFTLQTPHCTLNEVTFPQAQIIADDEVRLVHLILTPMAEEQSHTFNLFSRSHATAPTKADWTQHAAGTFGSLETTQTTPDLPALIQARCTETFPAAPLYDAMREHGFHLGSGFRWMETIWRKQGESLCRMRLPQPEDNVAAYQLHPGIIDSCFQLVGLGLPMEGFAATTYVPVGFTKLHYYGHQDIQANEQLWAYATVQPPANGHTDMFTGDVQLMDNKGRLIAAVIGLRIRRAGYEALHHASQKWMDEWLYKIDWQPITPDTTTTAKAPQRWLILADHTGIGSSLADQLQENGMACTSLFLRLDEYPQGIDPHDAEDLRTAVRQVLDSNIESHLGIVDLWSLDFTLAPEATAVSLQDTEQILCGHVLQVLQLLARQTQQVTYWVVTQAAQSVTSTPEKMQIHQTPLWGLGSVAEWEHPEIWGGLVDLPGIVDTQSVSLLLRLLLGGLDMRARLAIRNSNCYRARLVRQRQPRQALQTLPIAAEGTYLITGGLGGLGLQVAAWLQERGARHLILLSRSKMAAAAAPAVQALEAGGTQVQIVQADVSQRQSLHENLMRHLAASPPLRGVIHAAGLLDDGVLIQQSWEQFDRVLAPKMMGAWNLHQLTRTIPLDFFVLFSSAASLLGSPGQANYAAANAFLDALAHYRQAQGLTAVSINWGPWAKVGMAANHKTRLSQWENAGFIPLSPRQGMAVLERLILEAPAQIGVCVTDWVQFRRFYPTAVHNPFLADLITAETGATWKQENSSTELVMQQLVSLPPEQHLAFLTAHLRQRLARVMRMPVDEIDIHESLTQLGLDSLMTLELKNQLEADLQVKIPLAEILEGPSVAQLSDFLLAQTTAPPQPTATEQNDWETWTI